MPFLDHLLTYKITAYNTRPKRKKLSVGGLITPILCAAGVNPTDREPLNQVGWTSSFARPTSSLSTRSWMGGSNSSSHIHWLALQVSPAQPRAHHSCPGSADLGEPECYYFEEYEAPRMNPSVVAATRGLDFSKSSTSGKGKPLRRCKSPWTRW
ncbi:unnamed protein product [Microthlaspi erraticum]|uniref:Arabidopsis retrotransposon Orf1 C-terminal domain-containing protein n=1 Tax=Microthlaspi erraticum TaxID=1685480 RepID=A0A6D2HG56_9BRAS|nr:unnamed protein product [Microthlaspi erraticum]